MHSTYHLPYHLPAAVAMSAQRGMQGTSLPYYLFYFPFPHRIFFCTECLAVYPLRWCLQGKWSSRCFLNLSLNLKLCDIFLSGPSTASVTLPGPSASSGPSTSTLSGTSGPGALSGSGALSGPGTPGALSGPALTVELTRVDNELRGLEGNLRNDLARIIHYGTWIDAALHNQANLIDDRIRDVHGILARLQRIERGASSAIFQFPTGGASEHALTSEGLSLSQILAIAEVRILMTCFQLTLTMQLNVILPMTLVKRGTNCPVCITTLESGDCVELPCGHQLHLTCAR